eukprot:m51a1_g5862 hypothetical protein (371) ;mRNA; f:385512-387277
MSHFSTRGMGPLSLSNAQRSVAVLEEAIDKLSIAGVVSTTSSRFKEPLVRAVTESLTTFLAAGAQQKASGVLGDPLGTRELQVLLEVQSRELHITNRVLESSVDSGTTPETLKAEARRELLAQLLQIAVQELCTKRTYTALSTFVECERAARQLLPAAKERERLAMAEAARIAEESRIEEEEAKADRERQEAEMAELKQRLAEAKARSAIDGKVLKKELRARGETSRRVQAEREAQMTEEIEKLKKAIEIEDKHGRLQTTVNEWMNKYDVDTEDLQRRLESLRATKSNDLERLYELKDRSREITETIAKKRTAAELQKEYEELQVRREQAAVVIQSAWRGHVDRKHFRAMKRKLAARARKKGKSAAGKKK